MIDKYYLVNNYLPCICNCNESCLRKDLIERGYIVYSLKQVTEDEFFFYCDKLQKEGKLKVNLIYY